MAALTAGTALAVGWLWATSSHDDPDSSPVLAAATVDRSVQAHLTENARRHAASRQAHRRRSLSRPRTTWKSVRLSTVAVSGTSARAQAPQDPGKSSPPDLNHPSRPATPQDDPGPPPSDPGKSSPPDLRHPSRPAIPEDSP
jgi:hypothetical protein